MLPWETSIIYYQYIHMYVCVPLFMYKCCTYALMHMYFYKAISFKVSKIHTILTRDLLQIHTDENLAKTFGMPDAKHDDQRISKTTSF